MGMLDRPRLLARLNRTPKYATGGMITGSRNSDDVPAILSAGCTFVPGTTVGTHHAVVVVQRGGWEPVCRDDRPEWMTEATWDRIASEGR